MWQTFSLPSASKAYVVSAGMYGCQVCLPPPKSWSWFTHSCTEWGAPLVPSRASYLHLDLRRLPKYVMTHPRRSVSRSPLRAHTLAVISSIWSSGNGHCDKSSCDAVKNGVHALSLCQDGFVLSLKEWYSLLFFSFCQFFSLEAPHILHALPSQTVFDYLSQRHNKLCHLSRILEIVFWLASHGKDKQKTNQPNDQAGD